MLLYKNVDICDLKNILNNGILSLDESGNDNWGPGRRANNSTKKVYLFQPIDGKGNSFPKYGAALLAVDVDDPELSEIGANDHYLGSYIEYTVDRVKPEQIKTVYIPRIFKDHLHLSEEIEKAVTWCGFSADLYEKGGFQPAPDEVLQVFADTADVECSQVFNFFRGVMDGQILDLYNIRYN